MEAATGRTFKKAAAISAVEHAEQTGLKDDIISEYYCLIKLTGGAEYNLNCNHITTKLRRKLSITILPPSIFLAIDPLPGDFACKGNF